MGLQPAREAAGTRRQLLLDAAASIVAADGAEAVSMDSVAGRAEVSRALVYKHFANRQELLNALYERESSHLHERLSVAVRDAPTLEDMLRTLVGGALTAQARRGATFAALAAAGGRPPAQRAVQRRRDAQTLRYFVRRAVAELGLDEAAATAALGLALGSITIVLGQWRRRPTPGNAAALTETFVTMTMGGLRELADESRRERSR